MEKLRLMAVVAHPDDESLAFGGTLVKYATEGADVSVVVATRGQMGWRGPQNENPGPVAVGQIRESETREAAKYLGVNDLVFLDYDDGTLASVNHAGLAGRIEREIRRIKPQVVVTFGPDGAYGHPDHIAISQQTAAAVVLAADPSTSRIDRFSAHAVDKLYYRIWTQPSLQAYESAIGVTTIDIGNTTRRWFGWPEWAVSAQLDASKFWPNTWAAARCHKSQVLNREQVDSLPRAMHEKIWGVQEYYRAFTTVDTGEAVEDDLFAGLRHPVSGRLALAA